MSDLEYPIDYRMGYGAGLTQGIRVGKALARLDPCGCETCDQRLSDPDHVAMLRRRVDEIGKTGERWPPE